MGEHLVNPSALSFGIGVITPRWLYVLAAATPEIYGDPLITDETLQPLQLDTISSGDVVGIPLTRHWLIPERQRPRVYVAHPVMSAEEIRQRTQAAWDRFTRGVPFGFARVASNR
jgi:hypothetical protein